MTDELTPLVPDVPPVAAEPQPAPKRRMRWPDLPETVEALTGEPIKVVLVDAVIYEGEPDKNSYGLYEPEDHTIQIKKTKNKSQQWKTLRHEQAHALFEESGVSQALASKNEEALVRALANARIGWIERNHAKIPDTVTRDQVIAWLLEAP